MICPACSFDNPDGNTICAQCGAALALQCPTCGFDNPPGFRFCGRCGSPLVPPGSSEAAAVARVGAHEQGERRQLTVMFCDLVDSTPLSQRVDPEELRSIFQAYQQTCADVITGFDGYIAQYLGDGLLVYFGYPYAHEDDAVRASRAGLEIVRAIARLSRRLVGEGGVELAVRVGIHTGLVVIGDVGDGRAPLALGDTTNLASRLQGIAEPNTVVVSQATARLIAGFFDSESLGTINLKGFLLPVAVQRVVRESGAGNRVDAFDAASLTPLVGRDGELRRLESIWDQAVDGTGQAVTVCGEPGIGKSRIVKVFKDRLAARHEHVLIECRCSPYGQSSALKPVIGGLQQFLGVRSTGSDAERFAALESSVLGYGVALTEHLPFLAILLGVPLGADYAIPDLGPNGRRGRTLEAIIALLRAVARRQPVLFLLEDLHWVDPSTLELIDLFMKQDVAIAAMLLLSCRPQFRRTWTAQSRLTVIDVGRLSHAQVEAMVARITGGRALPREVLSQIVEKTDGVPLFVEELTKMVLESELLVETDDDYELTGPLPPLAIPTTLNDSLMARLDRLGAAKEIAQICATIGREFDLDLLRIVAGVDEDSLRATLARLVDAEILIPAAQQSDDGGHARISAYMFRHALIQDAAYESLLKSRRLDYHHRIACALEESFPDTIIEHPELLALHYTSAGVERRALFYWQLAGQHATERSAHVEAASHLRHALELIERMPPSRERTEQELAVQVALGVPLQSIHGGAASAVAECYARAYELCRELGETPHLFAVVRGLLMYYWVAGDLRRSKELGEMAIELAGRYRPEDQLVEAHRIAGPVCFWTGDFIEAERNLRRVVELYDPERHGQHAVVYGQDPKIVGLSYLALVEWFLGRSDRARETARQAIEHGRAMGHAQSYYPALVFSALLHHCLGDVEQTRVLATEMIELGTDHVFPMWRALGNVLLGWAIAESEDVDRGNEILSMGLAQWEATGAGIGQPFFHGLMVETKARSATIEQELALVEEGLDLCESMGERFWEAELFRLRGALQARRGPAHADAALASLERARDVAVRQGALAIELRIAISRYHVLNALGRTNEGHAELEAICARFTEGETEADMLRARRLLGSAPIDDPLGIGENRDVRFPLTGAPGE
jgi:class 3 adenylate cyclase/predicted ATPase